MNDSPAAGSPARRLDAPADLVEWYYAQGVTDGLPVAPPTPDKVAAMVEALGGDPAHVECRVPPRWGDLTREVLAINAVMAGCLPAYAPVVRAAMLALCSPGFNLNGVQATTHMAAPLLIVNGPVRNRIGMNAGCNAFGSGNRANATIGRAIAARPVTLAGSRLGVLDNSKWKAGDLLRRIVAKLEAEDGVHSAGYWRKESFSKSAPAATIEEIARASDVVLTAIGD